MVPERKTRYLLAALVLTVAAAGAGFWVWLKSHPAPIPEHLQNMGGDFTLQSADGPVSLSDFRGKVVLLYFGYANCPDACPLTLSNWARAFKSLTPKELARVRGIMVSVDPERDSPETLKTFATFFHPNIMGLTGSPETLRAVVDKYRSDFVIEKQSETDEDYEVAHMSFVYVIDPQGKVRDLLAHETPPADVVKSVRAALKVAG